MNKYGKAGFQDMPDVVHSAASRKGGRIKVKKGFAVNPELAREAGRKGGLSKHGNRSITGAEQAKEDTRRDGPQLADILGDINE